MINSNNTRCRRFSPSRFKDLCTESLVPLNWRSATTPELELQKYINKSPDCNGIFAAYSPLNESWPSLRIKQTSSESKTLCSPT